MMLPDEWQWLRDVTQRSGERYGMKGAERVLLYETAIQTGLRAGELRQITKVRLYLDAKPPYLLAKANTTKNAKDARQFLQADLAARLRKHVERKTPQAAVFALPGFWEMADMLRNDLADARREWIDAAGKDADERQRREQSDFLKATNDAGEILDFHSLRHTCGAWLAKAGVAPKVVQTVMRHATITLTMDTYGHLFPGEHAAAVDKLSQFLGGQIPQCLAATGTDGKQAQHSAQHFGREIGSAIIELPEGTSREAAGKGKRKAKGLADLGGSGRNEAEPVGSTPGRIRTCDLLIRSQLLYPG